MLNTIQSIFPSIGKAATGPIGNLVTETFSNGLGDYNIQTVGGATISINAGKLRLAGGAGLFTSYATFDKVGSPFRFHCFEKWKMKAKFTTPTLTGTTYGFGLGVRSTVTTSGFTALDTMVRLAMDSGSTVGSLWFYSASNHAATPNTDNQGSFALQNATVYYFEVERVYNQLIARIKSADGLTTHLTITKTYNISSITSVWSHNVGQFCIWNFGGTIDITEFTIDTDTQKNIDVLYLSDSNIHGLYCGSNANRFCAQASVATNKSYEILAGVDHGTFETLQLKPLIAFLNPKIVYINDFSNDVDHSVSLATTQANHDDLVTTIKSQGRKVIHAKPIARTLNFSGVNNYLDSTYSSDQIVNHYDDTRDSGTALRTAYNGGDGIHMNLAGNNAEKLPLITALQNV